MRDWRRVLRSALRGENVVVCGLIVGLGLLLTPLPGVVLDALLAANLGLCLAMLLVVLSVERPSRLYALPSWLVLSSLARIFLALGVARTALAGGSAGTLVTTLGGQMTGNGESLVGGIALLAMLGIVAYVVVATGVMRLAEVSARFALDALPGRQMALDSALTGGRLDHETGLTETRALQADSAFYGGMDGVARFLRGDVIACILVPVFLPLAALSSGAAEGITEYVTQAVGLGALLLVTAILASSAAVLALSRSAPDVEGASLLAAVLLRPALPAGVALVLLSLALAPGVAKLPLAGVAGLAAAGAWDSHRRRQSARIAATQETGGADLQLQLGLGLISLLAGNDLPALLATTRAQLADELGFAVPPLAVSDDADLPANDFALRVGGVAVMQATLRPGRRLLVVAGEGVLPPGGIETELPGGAQGTWLRAGDERDLPTEEYHILDPLQALLLYLHASLRAQAAELFDGQRAAEWLAAVQATHPASVAALERSGRDVAEVRAVGRELLREGIALRERVSLVDALGAAAPGLSAGELAESVRPALARTITRLVAPAGVAEVIVLGRDLEDRIVAATERAPGQPPTLPPTLAGEWSEALVRLGEQFGRPEQPTVVLCRPETRWTLAQLIASRGAAVRVVVAQELQPLTKLQTIQTIHTLQ